MDSAEEGVPMQEGLQGAHEVEMQACMPGAVVLSVVDPKASPVEAMAAAELPTAFGQNLHTLPAQRLGTKANSAGMPVQDSPKSLDSLVAVAAERTRGGWEKGMVFLVDTLSSPQTSPVLNCLVSELGEGLR